MCLCMERSMGGRGGRVLAVLWWPEVMAGGHAPFGAPILPWEAWGEAWAPCRGLCWWLGPGHAVPRLPGGITMFLLVPAPRLMPLDGGRAFSRRFFARCFLVTPLWSHRASCGSFLDNSWRKSTNKEGGTGRRTMAIRASGARCWLRTESSKQGCEAQIPWTASPRPLGAVSNHHAETIRLSHSLWSSAWCWDPLMPHCPQTGGRTHPLISHSQQAMAGPGLGQPSLCVLWPGVAKHVASTAATHFALILLLKCWSGRTNFPVKLNAPVYVRA